MRCDGSADCWRKQHRHSLGLALVPGCDQALGVLKHLNIRGATRGRFLFGCQPTLILHLAAVESHGRIVAEWVVVSMSAITPKADIQLQRNNGRFGPQADSCTATCLAKCKQKDRLANGPSEIDQVF
jgi:hypothetical protein